MAKRKVHDYDEDPVPCVEKQTLLRGEMASEITWKVRSTITTNGLDQTRYRDGLAVICGNAHLLVHEGGRAVWINSWCDLKRMRMMVAWAEELLEAER